jgi:hypothetical protein
MTYAELEAALTVFGFSRHDQLTLGQVKRRQRELSRRNHPDLQGNVHAMQAINTAAAVLTAYLNAYRFSFSEEDFYRQNPDELLRDQFSKDPWGT